MTDSFDVTNEVSSSSPCVGSEVTDQRYILLQA